MLAQIFTRSSFVSQAKHFRESCRLKSLMSILNEFDPSLEIQGASTTPASWYTNPKWLQEEENVVFSSNWLQVANVHQLKQPGDYVCGKVLKKPYIVVKGHDEVLRGFFNVCSHHAARIVNDNGHCATFTCPYHGWEYDTLGRLRKTVKMKGIENFRPKDHGLKEIRCSTLGHLVFLDFSGTADSLQSQFEVAQDILSEDGRYDNLTFLCQRLYTVNCNWKVYVDNYCDGGYHVPVAHKALNSIIDISKYENTIHDKFSVQSCKSDSKETENLRAGNSQTYMFLYPNCMINRYGNWLDTATVYPLGHGKCKVVSDYYLDIERTLEQCPVETAGSRREEWLDKLISDSLRDSDLVQVEDTDLCERVQEGLESGVYVSGRYVPALEVPMHHFHQLLHKNMKKHLHY